MNLLFKAGKPSEGYNLVVNASNAPLKLLEFGRLWLSEAGHQYRAHSDDREVVLDVLSGRCAVEVTGDTFGRAHYPTVGGRADVFSGKPSMVYVPRGSTYVVTALTPVLDVAVASAPSRRDTQPGHVVGGIESQAGVANWARTICTPIHDSFDADRLLVGETYNLPGNWSGFPPHKHDTPGPGEIAAEEVYFFQIKPTQGFGYQRIYTAPGAAEPISELYLIENDDTVVIPRGYHPVAAAAGYQLLYLWAIAGERRQFGAWSYDPNHAWVLACEPILRGR